MGRPARRGRVRAGGGGVPARERGRGRVCLARGRPAGRAGGGAAAGVSGRSAGGHARAPGPAPAVAKLPRRRPRRCRRRRPLRLHTSARRPPRSRPRSIKRSPQRVCAVFWTTGAYNRSHVKKKSLTSLFLTSAKILLRVPLAQFHSSKLWPFLRLPEETFLSPAFD